MFNLILQNHKFLCLKYSLLSSLFIITSLYCPINQKMLKKEDTKEIFTQRYVSRFKQAQSEKQEASVNTEPSDQVKIKLELKQCKQEKIQIHQQQSSQLNYVQQRFRYDPATPIQKKPKKRQLSQIYRIEDVRLIAVNFIQYGLNYRKFTQSYPDMCSKFYRNTVEAINNTAINQMQKYLRYECNIQIQKLNRDQKRSIRTQLTRVREWLSKRDMKQLQTWYKFIQRKYQLVDVQISIQEVIKLYKTILQIVKSPFVDVMEEEYKPPNFDQEIQRKYNREEKENQQKTLIFLFIQFRNLTKVSDSLCEKFGYTLKWSKHAVRLKIKHLLKISLKKLIGSVEAYDQMLRLYFSQSNQCVNLLINCETSLNLRCSLLGFYLQKTITLIELREYVRSLNKFFIQQYKAHGQYQCKKFQQTVKIPKLQNKILQAESQNTKKDLCQQKAVKKEQSIVNTEQNQNKKYYSQKQCNYLQKNENNKIVQLKKETNEFYKQKNIIYGSKQDYQSKKHKQASCLVKIENPLSLIKIQNIQIDSIKIKAKNKSQSQLHYNECIKVQIYDSDDDNVKIKLQN